jgi:hypothetical protein
VSDRRLERPRQEPDESSNAQGDAGRARVAVAASTAPRNVEVASAFDEIAGLLEVRGGNPYRVRAYRNAARTLNGLAEEAAAILARARHGEPVSCWLISSRARASSV